MRFLDSHIEDSLAGVGDEPVFTRLNSCRESLRPRRRAGRLGAVVLLLALVPAVVTGLGRAGADETATGELLARVRRGADGDEFGRAVAELRRRSPEAIARLDAALAGLAEREQRAWTVLKRRIDACAPREEEGQTGAAVRAAWLEAAAHARAWIFDETSFPVPAQALITGPMEGYEEAKRRGDAAVQAAARLGRLLDRALARLLALDPDEAATLLAAVAARDAAWQRLLEARGDPGGAPQRPGPDPRALELLALRAGGFAEASESFWAQDGPWPRVCLFHTYVRTVEDLNAKDGVRLSRQAQRGLELLGRYRAALGVSPVRYNAKLARMATEHADEMMRLGYFSHRSPLPERATKEMRAHLAGYEGRVVECITGARGPQGAIEFWKYDGGHHRDMIDPRWVEGGFSERGAAVYDGGSGEPGAVPVIHYAIPGE